MAAAADPKNFNFNHNWNHAGEYYARQSDVCVSPTVSVINYV